MTRSTPQRLTCALFLTVFSACALQSRQHDSSLCYGVKCLSLDRMEKSLHAQPDGKTVGYAYVIGRASPVSGSGGLARTSADGPALQFTPQTRITVAVQMDYGGSSDGHSPRPQC
jgi:hypothetical protein